jgi:hypothetical protein
VSQKPTVWLNCENPSSLPPLTLPLTVVTCCSVSHVVSSHIVIAMLLCQSFLCEWSPIHCHVVTHWSVSHSLFFPVLSTLLSPLLIHSYPICLTPPPSHCHAVTQCSASPSLSYHQHHSLLPLHLFIPNIEPPRPPPSPPYQPPSHQNQTRTLPSAQGSRAYVQKGGGWVFGCKTL